MGSPASLLPYRSEFGWRFGRSISDIKWLRNPGEVRIEDEQLILTGTDGAIAACPIREVSVSRVWFWFGDGVRLDLGAEGRWYVKPPFRTGHAKAARRDTRLLVEAIADAQRIQ